MLSNEELARVLEDRFLHSTELSGLPIKTRAKRARIMACEALGYPVPKAFPRTQPRFVLEDFDLCVQQASNYQLWNTDIRLSQRYVFVIVDNERVHSIRVLTGLEIASLPQTGTRTIKYQARFRDFGRVEQFSTVHGTDTEILLEYRRRHGAAELHARSVGVPPDSGLLALDDLGAELGRLIGVRLRNPGATQERLRGQALHEAVCEVLGYDRYADSGQHPDIPNQLLEIKLQTSPTIDLGLVEPGSTDHLPPPFPDVLRVCDVRYAVFGATHIGDDITRINNVHLTTGATFDHVFERMRGLGMNSKIQIRLPRAWFD